jgi:hypothetical protein
VDRTYPQHSHDGEWGRFILYCKDYFVAAEYAAERSWWLHCWNHKVDDDASDDVVEIDLWEKTQ